MTDVSTLLSRLASKKVAERDPAEARGSRRNPRRNPVRFPRSESKQPSPKLNAASSSSSSCCDALLTLVHRQPLAPPPGMERPEELQPPEEGSGEKPPVMSPNVAVWKMRNTWRCRLIRVLPTMLCERSSCEIILISSRNCFNCAFPSVLWLFFPLFPRFLSPHSAAPTLPRVSMVPRQTC